MLTMLYRTLTRACAPFVPLYLKWRTKKGVEETPHLQERYGRSLIIRPQGKLVWVHAASVGEMRSALPLVEHILKHNDDVTCLITTVTHTAARLVRNLNQTRILHQYSPIDHPTWIERFLTHWQPDTVFWMESEIWPNTLNAIKYKNTPLIMINGRMSERSAKRWHFFSKTIQSILGNFDLLIAQSVDDAKRLKQLGGHDVRAHGNIKFVGHPLHVDENILDQLRQYIGMRPAVLFASTHKGEEEIASDVHQTLTKTHSKLISIIMPRHPARGDDITAMLQEKGLRVSRRSLNEPLTPDTDIYLADTLGEAGLFYALCRVVYMGNSLIDKPGGGHNPIEPAMHDCAVLYGPNMWNFDEIDKGLRHYHGTKMVKNTDELTAAMGHFLSDDHAAQNMAKAARAFVDQQSSILDNVINDIRPYLRKVGVQA